MSLYVPSYAKVEDENLIFEVMQRYSFALLITPYGSSVSTTHLPVLVDRPRRLLHTHLAKVNPHYQALQANTSVTVVFNGPYAYVSPAHYKDQVMNVPTWNYVSIHCQCTATLLESETGIEEILSRTVAHFEGPKPKWSYQTPQDYRKRLITAISGVELKIESIEAKFKLSQNRKKEDYEGVLKHFESQSDENSRNLYEYMIKTRP